MAETTGISWTDHTHNHWIGCARVSDGCLNCYAEARNDRYGEGLWGKNAPRRLTSEANRRLPLRWERQAIADGRPHLVFCSSLADVFEDRPDTNEWREGLFDLIEQTPHLIWQLLTKRPENVLRLVPEAWVSAGVDPDGVHYPVGSGDWPANVWIGTTVEHQRAADERIPILARIPAPVRFLSCEPLLGPILLPLRVLCPSAPDVAPQVRIDHVDWVIVGGESGPGYRPMQSGWATSIVADCELAGVPVFFKQVGGTARIDGVSGGDMLDGRRIKQFPPQAGRDVPVAVG